MFEGERHEETESDAEGHGGREGEEEDAYTVEDGCEAELCPMELRERPGQRSEKENKRES